MTPVEPVRASWLRRQRTHGVLVGLLVLALLANQVAAAWGRAFGFDEALNLQVTLNLLEGNGYASDGALFGGQVTRFDAFMTTGPTVMLPVTGVVALLGEHSWAFRLVPLASFVALVAVAGCIGRRLAGRVGAATSMVAVLALSVSDATYTDSPLAGAGDVLGEVTAALLIGLAALLLHRPGWAGLVLGLAVLAKIVALFFVPAALVAVVIMARRGATRGNAVRSVIWWGGALLAPTLAYQAVRWMILGRDGAVEANADFVVLMSGHGSGMTARGTGSLPEVGHRLTELMGLTAWWVLAIFCVVAALVAAAAARGGVSGVAHGWFDDAVRPHAPLLVAIVGGSSTIGCWWLLVSSRDWVRHVMPGVYVAVPVLAALALAVILQLDAGRLRRSAVALGGVGLVSGAAVAGVAVWQLPGPDLDEQRYVADFASRQTSEIRFLTWHQVPEMRLHGNGLRSVPLDLERPAGVMVLTRSRPPVNVDFDAELTACDQVLLSTSNYVVCTVDGSG